MFQWAQFYNGTTQLTWIIDNTLYQQGKNRNRDEASPITNIINKVDKTVELPPDTSSWAVIMYTCITTKIDTTTKELTPENKRNRNDSYRVERKGK